jgi:hypothetical protein
VGLQFEPNYLHHPVHSYRTPPDIGAFVPWNVGFLSLRSSLNQSPQDENGIFTCRSLHRKIPFLARETRLTTERGLLPLSHPVEIECLDLTSDQEVPGTELCPILRFSWPYWVFDEHWFVERRRR